MLIILNSYNFNNFIELYWNMFLTLTLPFKKSLWESFKDDKTGEPITYTEII